MRYFRRVEGEQAGPAALGILVPPGPRTIVVLRPRALTWDLVLIRAEEASSLQPPLMDLDQAEAAKLAEDLFEGLQEWKSCGAVEVVPLLVKPGHLVQVQVGGNVLLACRRVPGKPYQPRVFASAVEAREVAAMLTAALCPEDGMELEVYFNTRNFK